ncbi:MAG: hypothetical protein M3Z33_09535 [Actinomycetota bacterium]|nr:hypothetical protein [Actinomycetota bacterium]
MLANVERDMHVLPALHTVVTTGRAPWEQAVRDILVSGWKPRGQAPQRLLGAIGLACSFAAWQRLVRREGLSDIDAIEVLAGLIAANAWEAIPAREA